MALIDILKGYWPHNEASGNAADLHSNGYTLTDNNTVGSTTGKVYGTARQFTAASSERFTRADNADLSIGPSSFTFDLWVWFDDLATYRPIVSKYDFGSQLEYFFTYHAGAGVVRFHLNHSGGSVSVEEAAAPPTGEWIHYIIWYNASAQTLNIKRNNGTARTTNTGAITPNDSTAVFEIGAWGNSFFHNGRIGPVAFWKRTLTSDEHTELDNSGNGLPYESFGGGAASSSLLWTPRSQFQHLLVR